MKKAIITAAITGGAHTPSMSPYLPVTPDEIAEQAIEAVKAGAAIVHLHARNPEDGRPTGSPQVFREFVGRIKCETDAIVNISTGGGGPGMPINERAAAGIDLQPEMCSLNMGSINLNLSEMAKKDREWKYDWEVQHLEATKDLVFKNTYADIEWILKTIGGAGTRFEFECYDTAHLYTLDYFWRQGLVKPPFFVQGVFGILGGIGTHPADIQHLRETAARLFHKNLIWSAFGAGRSQLAVAVHSVMSGGHVRVGLEDSLWAGKDTLWRSNAEQVRRIRTVIESLGLEIATPDDAREILALRDAPSNRAPAALAGNVY